MTVPLNVVMISTHPAYGGGVSSYTEKLIHFLRDHGLEVNLFSNKVIDNSKEDFEDICSCWDTGFLYPFQIFKNLCKCKPDIIHIQHEFFLYGGVLSALLFPVLLFLAKIAGRKVIVTLHGVIPLSEVHKRFLTLNEIDGPSVVLKIGLVFLTKTISLLTDAVIVHSNFFAETLMSGYGCMEEKVQVIPHGVNEVASRLSQNIAKERIGLSNKIVILFFGYIAKYKGIETLLEGFQLISKEHPNWVLIIGGGQHPRLKTKRSYREYLSNLYKREDKQVSFRGYIADDYVSTYFCAADLVVLPYNLIMSSSGPFALATSYGKSVVASNIPPFNEFLPSQALFNEDDSNSLRERIENILSHPSSMQEISAHIEKIGEANSWTRVSLKTRKLYQHVLGRIE